MYVQVIEGVTKVVEDSRLSRYSIMLTQSPRKNVSFGANDIQYMPCCAEPGHMTEPTCLVFEFQVADYKSIYLL